MSLAIDVVPGQPEWRRPEHAHRHIHIHSSPSKHLFLMFLGLPAVTVKFLLTCKILTWAFLWHYAKPLQYWQVENIAHIFPSMWLQYSSIKKILKQVNHTDFRVTLHTSMFPWYLLYQITIIVSLSYWNTKGWCYKQELLSLQEPTWFYKTIFQINVWLHGSFLPLTLFGTRVATSTDTPVPSPKSLFLIEHPWVLWGGLPYQPVLGFLQAKGAQLT